jgi:hypothetical protein
MKHIIVTIFLVLGLLTAEPQTKRALIIGIGTYPAESGWCTIHGDNDVHTQTSLSKDMIYLVYVVECL